MTDSKRFQVGIGPKVYGALRCFADAPVPNVSFVQLRTLPLHRLASFAPASDRFTGGVTAYLPSKACDLFHSFNAIVLNSAPWLVSFESLMPRTWLGPRLQEALFARLARPNCRAVLASSQNALLHMELRNRGFRHFDHVMSKTEVVYPGVEDLPRFDRSDRQEDPGAPIKLIYVGNMFQAKGGEIALKLFEALRGDYDLEMTVVSALREGNPFSFAMEGSPADWKRRIAEMGIVLRSKLSFEQTRELISRADILLLPSFDESFSFCTVEALACGTIPVVPRIRALPELVVHEESGFLVDVPVDREGRMILDADAPRSMQAAFLDAMRGILDRRESFGELRRAGRARYEARFSQACLVRNLSRVYERLASS